MAEANAPANSAEASLADHRAVRAWRKLGLERGVPENVELLKEDRGEGGVYRLVGVGPEGASVIAKRCDSDDAGIECLVYKQILPWRNRLEPERSGLYRGWHEKKL